jgi:hypothetical protein
MEITFHKSFLILGIGKMKSLKRLNSNESMLEIAMYKNSSVFIICLRGESDSFVFAFSNHKEFWQRSRKGHQRFVLTLQSIRKSKQNCLPQQTPKYKPTLLFKYSLLTRRKAQSPSNSSKTCLYFNLFV